MTTANLLLTLHGGFQGPREEMLFSDVMDAVLTGEADMGVIIHEGRFTYADRGLVKLLDLGQWWEATYHAPLPLGAIAVRRDVPVELAAPSKRPSRPAWTMPMPTRAPRRNSSANTRRSWPRA